MTDTPFTVDALDAEAASGLLTLQQVSHAPETATMQKHAVSNRSSRRPSSEDSVETAVDATDVACKYRSSLDEEQASPPGSANATPVREFKLAGAKRVRDDLVTLCYTSGTDQMIQVPYFKGETLAALFTRRDEAARRLFDANRGEVYCSWRSTMINLVVHDAH